MEDARSGPAVQLLTVHAAKGLEWPVVCIADLGASRPPTSGRLLVDPRRGLAFRPAVPWSTDPHPTPRSAALAELLASRDLAESRRVLYVAMTRARDRLVLSGIQGRASQRSWASWIDPVLDAPEVRPRVRRVDEDACPPLPPRPPAAPVMVDPEQVRAGLRRLEPFVASAAPAVPLEALDALEGCRRRFQLRFLEGHREPGLGAAAAPDSPRHRDRRLDVIRRLLGQLAMDAWRDGIPDDALATATGRIGLTLAEAEALQLVGPLRRLARMLHGFTTGFSWVTGVPLRHPLGSVMVHGVLDLHLSGAPGDAAVCLVPGRHAGFPAGLSIVLAGSPDPGRNRAAGQGRALRDRPGGRPAALGLGRSRHPGRIEARLRSAGKLGPALADGLERRGL